jgi:hypothetical protein
MRKYTFPPGTYLTYPQANGFAEGVKCLVLGQNDESAFSPWKFDLPLGNPLPLARFLSEAARDVIAL